MYTRNLFIYMCVCIYMFTWQHVCGLHLLSSNKNCTSRRIFCFAMYFLHRRKSVLGKCVLTTGFKMQQLSGNEAAWTLISIPELALMWNCCFLEREEFSEVGTWGRGVLFHVSFFQKHSLVPESY